MNLNRFDRFSPSEYASMQLALRLARQGQFTTRTNPQVGCVLVKDGQIVGRGLHWRPGEPHAEVNALREAGSRARGATAYVTLEPCCHHGRTGPCADALIEAGVARVIAANKDPNPRVDGGGFAKLRAAGIECQHGLLASPAAQLNAAFFKRQRTGLPWLRVKLAASLDARTALADGNSAWITGSAARLDVQWLRARACAVLSGSDTVLNDDPSLTVRIDRAGQPCAEVKSDIPQPLRVIVDGR
ncbi:MAG: bifunctional diaminohydroxyphosphoribosylaminopyrimidine deaminase/5-amino-6-(5-phosphoribosylamino)uracil reductase RibD, partial [Gammaproteobacteria bacterium]